MQKAEHKMKQFCNSGILLNTSMCCSQCVVVVLCVGTTSLEEVNLCLRTTGCRSFALRCATLIGFYFDVAGDIDFLMTMNDRYNLMIKIGENGDQRNNTNEENKNQQQTKY
jgi:hypothetical protein